MSGAVGIRAGIWLATLWLASVEVTANDCRAPTQAEFAAHTEWLPAVSETLHLSATSPQGPLHWWMLNWEGPTGGILFVADCSGRILDSASLGAIVEQALVPVADWPWPVVRLEVVVGTGTGFRQEDTVIVTGESGRLREVFRHVQRLHSDSGCSERTAAEFSVRIRPDGREVVVRGLTLTTHGTGTSEGCRTTGTTSLTVGPHHWQWVNGRYTRRAE